MARSDRVGWGPQMDEDTATAVLAFSAPVNSFEKDVDQEELNYVETTGNRAPSDQEEGGRTYPLTMQGAARPRSFGSILSHFFGQPDSSQPDAVASPTVWEHSTDPLGAVVRPVPTSFWAKTDTSRIRGEVPYMLDKFAGAIGNSLQINAAVNGYLVYNAGYAARTWIPDPPLPAFTQEAVRRWPFHEIYVEMAVGNDVLARIATKEWGFSFSNNLVMDEYILGQLDVDSLPLGDITGQVTFRPTRNIIGHARRALAVTPEDFKLKLVAESKVLIPGTTRPYKFELALERVQSMSAPVNIGAGDTLRDVEVSARYVFNEATGKLLTTKLQNDYDGADYKRRALA